MTVGWGTPPPPVDTALDPTEIGALLARKSAKVLRKGTHRCATLQQTSDRLEPLQKELGITRVANVTGLDRIGIPVVMVVVPMGLSLSVFQGKGTSLQAAKISGLMEAVERIHGEQPFIDVHHHAYCELKDKEDVLDPRYFAPVSGSHYHDDLRLPWVQAYDIQRDEAVWMPFEPVAFQPALRKKAWSGCFRSNSTGLSSGNSLLEAVVHGLCEVIERDAHTFWLSTPEVERAARRIDIDSVSDDACRELINKFEHANVAVAAWNITHELGVPTILVNVLDAMGNPTAPFLMGGFGTHPCRNVALSRALTEAAQSRATLIAGSRDDIRRSMYALPDRSTYDRWLQEIKFAPKPTAFEDLPSYETDCLADDLVWLRLQLARSGLSRILIVPLTSPNFGVPVVRVVVPNADDGFKTPGYIASSRLRDFRKSWSEH